MCCEYRFRGEHGIGYLRVPGHITQSRHRRLSLGSSFSLHRARGQDREASLLDNRRSLGDSPLGFWDATAGEQGANGSVGGLRVADMLGLATTGSRAFAFESPGEADIVARMLGDFDAVAFHHGSDIAEL